MPMKKVSVILLVCLIVAMLCACGPQITPVTTTQPATEAVSAVPTDTATEAPTSKPTQAPAETRTKYDLTAVLDYAYSRIDVDEKVVYTNRSTAPLTDLVLVVEANLQANLFYINSLTWSNGTAVDGYTLNRHRLTVPLKESLQPGNQIELDMSYSLYPPNTEGVLCFTQSQLNMAGWYPYVAPYVDGRSWIVNEPGSVGEYQVYELADFNVSIKLDGAPSTFMLAASSRATMDGDWYRFTQTDARNFTWSASNSYQMLEAYAGDIRVRAFVFPWDTVGGQASLDATIQALNLYAELYGTYDQDSLTIVEASFADGMEYDGLYFIGQEYFNNYKGEPSSYLTAISVHETAHQWWFGMVENDQANEPWLDEVFSIYSELLYYERYSPDLVDWWWQTRIDPFNPTGAVDSTIYDFYYFRPYVDAVYLRGARFMRDLRQTIGDDIFMKFLHDYFTMLHERADADHLGLATAADFWQVLGTETNADLSALKTEYFSKP
jgi:hypothetical protein